MFSFLSKILSLELAESLPWPGFGTHIVRTNEYEILIRHRQYWALIDYTKFQSAKLYRFGQHVYRRIWNLIYWINYKIKIIVPVLLLPAFLAPIRIYAAMQLHCDRSEEHPLILVEIDINYYELFVVIFHKLVNRLLWMVLLLHRRLEIVV